ncbi:MULTISPECIES: methyltransferase domain-containing protein [Burkholderia cepacia complex]|uniref:methyltransferase domain-containing protein n=1 Tax=Burkholderia cepacia complex TaxID=87882 RepID=UPI001CF3147B|nr:MULTISPECIES: methyltransferase domain-containing protein [Burkholderia cepacia complex]MCA8057383.1 methyltransferase domain-containing protein [Burkholderia cepacia]MDN7535208.1 methyltransferase domain-containing protein [Burkholderia orbicola]
MHRLAGGILAKVEAHYEQGSLLEEIKRAFARMGMDDRCPSSADLAHLDAFHLGGLDATIQLARQVPIGPNFAVLDVGCGLGGSSRYLAETYGCTVLGIDLTEEYVSVASDLSAWTGCGNSVRFLKASALEMPVGDAQFDLVWTQHVQMNVPKKRELYREFGRVLKPGGVLLFHEVFLGSAEPVRYPVPWASEKSISFLTTPREARDQIEAAGFVIDKWDDVSERDATSLRRVAEGMGSVPPRLPLSSMLLGADAALKLSNALLNLAEGRIKVFQAVARRV